MYESYADVLESYMIAEEGFKDKIKNFRDSAIKMVLKAIHDLMEKVNNLIMKIKRYFNKRKNEYEDDYDEWEWEDKFQTNYSYDEYIDMSKKIDKKIFKLNSEIVKINRDIDRAIRIFNNKNDESIEKIDVISNNEIDEFQKMVDELVRYQSDEIVYCVNSVGKDTLIILAEINNGLNFYGNLLKGLQSRQMEPGYNVDKNLNTLIDNIKNVINMETAIQSSLNKLFMCKNIKFVD